MNRRDALIAAGTVLAGAALAKVPLLAEGYEEYCVRRLRQAIVAGHGQQAFERYRDILEHSARQFAKATKGVPRRTERMARVEKTWVDLVGHFEEQRRRAPVGAL